MSHSQRLVVAAIVACGLAFVILPSIPRVRRVLSAPLVVHTPDARGDACYVLCGGGAEWERLDAAADLVGMGRVRRVILMEDGNRSRYSFTEKASWTRGRWMTEYLAWQGVSPGNISWIPQGEGFFGTLAEAGTVASHLPKDVHTLVLVTSAPHTRRSLLAFQRTLAGRAVVVPYAATGFEDSFEMHHPIWLEYLKLLTYYAVS